MASEEKVKEVLGTLKKRFPRREGTQQFNLQKMHGAFKMAKIHPCCLGSSDETNSSYGKRMHHFFTTMVGYQTQQKTHDFAQQVATCYYDVFAIDKAE